MLHIKHKTENTHKKAFAVEVFIGMMLFSIFHTAFTQASDITADNIINLVNKARVDVNAAVLVKNDLLEKAAQKKAQDMIDNNYFAHVSPEGKSPWFWIEKTGYDYQYAGENLAINYTNAKDEHNAWMESPSHRKNILNSDYQEIGVAVREGTINGHKTIVAVQMFGAKNIENSVSPVVSTNPQQATVAGAFENKNNLIGKKMSKIDFDLFYQTNKQTLNGWLIAFGIALTVVFVDIAALIHKRHAQLLILHTVRNRQS